MFLEAIQNLKQRKYITQAIIFFIIFMIIYTIIDSLNMSYANMLDSFGLYLVVINISLNVLMSALSAFLMHLSTSMIALKNRNDKGSALGFISILFGILTYGCTSCVIAFFASIGIAFSVIALPLAGLPYKLISLLLIVAGIFFIKYELEHSKCKVKLVEKS